jgi:SAM-dependent methyltransferase
MLLAATGALAGIAVATHFAFFVLPLAWTGEAFRLAALLGLHPGQRVADIGAGDGSHAVAIARLVGPDGEVLATDLDAGRRRAIADRASHARVNVRVLEGAAEATNLPDGCCDAIYMRTMLHHVDDPFTFARDVARSVRQGGRIAVIDFAPGRLWFHGADHGIDPDDVIEAFGSAGCTLRRRDDHWGGPMFLLLFGCGNEPGARPDAYGSAVQ